MMAGWVTGQVLLQDLPSKARGAVAVAPFGSLDELRKDLGIRETDSLPRRLKASQGLHRELVSVIVGREFLVPAGDDWSELDLLREAVEVAAGNDFRPARRDFHTSMLEFVGGSYTDYDSIKTAVEIIEPQLARLNALTRKRRRWKRLDRTFFFSQIGLDVAIAPLNPLALAHAAVAIGRYTTSEKLGDPASPYANGPVGGLLHDAQEKLDLDSTGTPLPPTGLVNAKVFGRS